MDKKAAAMAARHHPRYATVRSAFVLDSNNLGMRVVSGSGFSFLGIALRTLLTIGSISVLARLLTPADFGHIAMATVVTEFAALLGSFGLSNILIQRRVINRLQLDTVFWTSLTIGVLMALGVFSLSFATGWLFADELTGSLLRILCLNFIFSSLVTVHQALLLRLMRFRTEFLIQISAIIIRSIVAILLAYLGFGVWSLVAGALTGAIVVLILMIAALPYVPRRRLNHRYLLARWKTSGSYMGNTILYYVNTNLDLLLIGRQLGAHSLGFYQNARALTDDVRGRIAIPLQHVLFPAFSAIQADRARLQQSVLRAARLLAAVICPVGFGLSAVALEIVPTLYGDQWMAMIPVLSMLGISGALRGSTAIASPLFNSRDRVGLAFRYNLVGAVVLAASVLAALPHGLEFVAAAIAANGLYSLVVFRVGLGLIGLNAVHVLHVLARPIIASLLMWMAIALVRNALDGAGLHVAMRLLVFVSFGAIVYALSLHLLSRQYLRDFSDIAGRLRKVRATA